MYNAYQNVEEESPCEHVSLAHQDLGFVLSRDRLDLLLVVVKEILLPSQFSAVTHDDTND